MNEVSDLEFQSFKRNFLHECEQSSRLRPRGQQQAENLVGAAEKLYQNLKISKSLLTFSVFFS